MAWIKKNCAACFDLIDVRIADHTRGWGKFCDKSCAAAYKVGMRPRDVNANHAKYSSWASVAMDERNRLYGGKCPPKAPSIQQQLGKSLKVKHKLHSPRKALPCKRCGTVTSYGYHCQACASHLEGLEAMGQDYLNETGSKT